jgi:hypothetical protein
MTDRTQFEAMLEALINEDQESAKEIFHNIVVAKSREIYEELLETDGFGIPPEPQQDQGTMEAPLAREPWMDLAQSCYEKALWRECYYAATTALSITNRELVYTADADCWGYKLYDLAAISAYYLGLKDEAVKWGLVAQELEPTNERLAKNILFYTGQIQNK